MSELFFEEYAKFLASLKNATTASLSFSKDSALFVFEKKYRDIINIIDKMEIDINNSIKVIPLFLKIKFIYLIASTKEYVGNIIATANKPTAIPINTIRNGSIIVDKSFVF